MDVLNHLLAALGRILLSISGVLAVEELTLGGLARILLSMPYDSRRSGSGRRRAGAKAGVILRLLRHG
jgi:hypothetical protein